VCGGYNQQNKTKHTLAGDPWVVKVESSGEDPRATEGLVSNLPYPRVNKIKQLEHTLFRLFKTSGAFFIFGIKIKQQPWP